MLRDLQTRFLLQLRIKYDLLLPMKTGTHLRAAWPFLATSVIAATLWGQGSVDTRNWNAPDDHRNMLDQLGIKALRPGPSGNESAANHANYDEAKANPYPDLPDVLMLKNGKKVTT